jgi:uncharacterized protein DUF5670
MCEVQNRFVKCNHRSYGSASSLACFHTQDSIRSGQNSLKTDGMLIANLHDDCFCYKRKLGDVVDKRREEEMLWTIFVILLVLWLLGVVSSYTVGGFIHLLLVLALVVLLINIIGGRRTVV